MTNFDINKIKRENLRRIMDMKGLTPTRLAELIGVQQPHISACLNGARNMGQITINKICEALKIDKGEFFNIDAISVPAPERINKPIPVISWVHAGQFTECADRWPAGVSGEGDPVFSNVKTSDRAFGLRIEGDSMLPRFMPGDIAIIDPTIRCDNGAPCVVWVNGDVSIKLLYDGEKEIRLVPTNDRHQTIVIPKDSRIDFRVIGKVVDIKPKMENLSSGIGFQDKVDAVVYRNGKILK